jgi:hypothetical protein
MMGVLEEVSDVTPICSFGLLLSDLRPNVSIARFDN